MKGSAAKGNKLEKEVATLLSKVVYGREFVLRRVPLLMAGGWTKQVSGDVVVDPTALLRGESNWDVYCECKNYADFGITDIFKDVSTGKQPLLETFWITAIRSAGDRKPLLVFRAARWVTPLAAVRNDGFPVLPVARCMKLWNGEDIALFRMSDLSKNGNAAAFRRWARPDVH